MTKVVVLLITQLIQGHIYNDVQVYASAEACETAKANLLSRLDLRPDAKEFSARCISLTVIPKAGVEMQLQ